MKKQVVFYFIACLLIQGNTIKAQQEKGQITINADVGYSPEFNGTMNSGGGPLYPVPSNGNVEVLESISVVPNIGGTIEYGLTNLFSIGLASSYQSVVVDDKFPYNNGDPTDKITRVNMAIRALFHLNIRNPNFDHYIGFRIGCNYWNDKVLNPGSQDYFLDAPNSFISCYQVVYGMRIYFTHNIGIHFEVGIGQPYLAEVGLTFKINTHKSIAAPPNNKAGQEIK